MSKKNSSFPKKHKVLTTFLTGVLGAVGIKYQENQQSVEKFDLPAYHGEIQRAPDIFYRAEVDQLHKKLMKNKTLSQEEISLLFEVKTAIDSLSPQGSDDHLLTQMQKDLRYFANNYNYYITKARLDKQMEELINKYEGKKLPVDYTHNIRNKKSSLDLSNNTPTIDYTKINLSLSHAILKHSKEYGINSRLVTAICTIENNFGLTKTSHKGAKGMCQTKPERVREFYPNYDSMSVKEKEWAHFETTFKYLEYLKNKYSLSISQNSDPFTNKKDFLKAAYLYHSGETFVLNHGGNLVEGTDGKKYVLKILDSFNFPRFILAKGENEVIIR